MTRAGLRSAAGAAGAAMVLVATAAQAHPLHTTITEIAFSDGAFRTTIRVFADDFGRAVAGLGPGAPAPASVDDAAAAAYVRSHFAVTGPDGRPVVLRWCGMERREGVYLLCVGGALGRLDGAMIHDRLQWELYPDQVNIVQASYAGRRETLLFTRNDPPRRLPAT